MDFFKIPLLFSLLLIGCKGKIHDLHIGHPKVNKEFFFKLKKGQTIDQVISILGEPASYSIKQKGLSESLPNSGPTNFWWYYDYVLSQSINCDFKDSLLINMNFESNLEFYHKNKHNEDLIETNRILYFENK